MARVLAFVAGVAVAGAGCASLAGIDDTTGDARGSNAVELTRISIGAQVVTTPLDLTGLQATYLVPNAANPAGVDRVPAINAGPGKWTADLSAAAPVDLTVPEVPPIPRLFSFPNPALKVPFNVFEHPNPTPAPTPAMLDLTVQLDAATVGTEGFQIFTVGAWSQRTVDPADLPMAGSVQLGPLSYDFHTSTSLSGRPLDALTQQDRFFVLRYDGTELTGVAEVPPFDQTGADTLVATMVPVTLGEPLDVRIEPARLTTRYASVRPAVSDLQMGWSLTAAPGLGAAKTSGPVLQSGALAENDSGVTVAYGNPFTDPMWRTAFTLTTLETRVYTPPGGTMPVTLQAGMSQVLIPSTGFVLTVPAGLPELITLDRMPLSTDGQTIAAPTKLVEVTFVADTPVTGAANATLYTLGVFDLLPNAAMTGLEYHQVLAATGSEAKFELPPEIFQVGHSYTLRATCHLAGYPAIASGDLVMRDLPFAESFLDSAVITVTP
ncbi:MAG: hypothetical protein ABIY55_13920 [Kofleriaceae bacterium]